MSTSTIEPDVDEDAYEARKPPKHAPRYHVILWNDDHHSAAYVMKMLQELFGYEPSRAYELMIEVDEEKKAVVYTTTATEAKLKRDQIHAYGKDAAIKECEGSMSATLEPTY